jgi:RNA polymerase sigma factor (sigma-70 family)
LFGFGFLRVFTYELKMTASQQLLAEYVTNGSESAFRELVVRYLDLVFSTAVRLVGGDTHLAQDVAQTVFVDLARKACTLPRDVMVGGWLHRHTCFVASKIMRGERRRRFRERQAVAMNEQQDNSEANLAQVTPILDEVINQLGAEDRTAILLRFFEQRDLQSIGKAMGSSEDAARMRVNRALEKLHFLLRHRGVNLSVTALGVLLAAKVVTAAPAGLALTISNAALAGAVAGTGTMFTLLKCMTMTNLKLGLGVMVVAGAVTTSVIQRQAQAKLRSENESLRQQITQLQSDNQSLSRRKTVAKPMIRLPAPQVHPAALPVEPPAADWQSIHLQLRKDGKVPKLTADQIEAYLKANQRNAASLLAAFRNTGNLTLLREAMQKYPNDPQVDFAAAINKDLTPQEQRQSLDAFEKLAPDNALANYLSANNYFNSGQTDQAVQELVAAASKTQLQDYAVEDVQNVKEAYLAAGYSDTDAEAIALMQQSGGLPNPNLMGLRQLADNMVNLANSYAQGGDMASAQATLQMVVNLGQQYLGLGEKTAVTQIIGQNIEQVGLAAMDPSSPYGDAGQTVQDQIAAIAQQRAALMQLGQEFQAVQPMMTTQDWFNYTDRVMVFGQQAANQWVVGKYAQH